MKTLLKTCLQNTAVLVILWGSCLRASGEAEDIHVFDLWKFFENEVESTEDRADFTYFITALQGIVNREKPRLYLRASLSLLDIETRHSTSGGKPIEVTDLDQFWLDYMIKSGDLEGRKIIENSALVDLLEIYKDEVEGLAIWEIKVPATVNAALAAAGSRNLLPVGSDMGSGLLKAWLKDNASWLNVKLDLTGKFMDSDPGGTFALDGVQITSSGSAKNDVYQYIRKAFLETGANSPFFMYYNSDAIMWGERRKMYSAGKHGYLGDRNELQQNGMFNNDYWIAKKGLFLDLYPWADQAPNDDPHQRIGADFETWNDILEESYKQRKGEFGVIGGFVPWWIKYVDEKYGGVATEWRFIDLITSYNMVNDGDAAFGLSNASFFSHLKPIERNKIPAPPNETPMLDSETIYLSFFMLDYDSSAWLNQAAEAVYEAGGRGRIPLNWAVNPILSDRVPHAYRYMIENRTDLDFFGIENNGAGYFSPYRLLKGKRLGRIKESGIPFYEKFAKTYHERFGIEMTAFYVTKDFTAEWAEMAARLTPTAFGMNIPSPVQQFGDTQVATLESFHVNEIADLRDFVEGLYKNSAQGDIVESRFYPIRCILYPPYAVADLIASAQENNPGAKVKVVDAFTFYKLRAQQQVTHLKSSFRNLKSLHTTPTTANGIIPTVSNVSRDSFGRFEIEGGNPPAWVLGGDPAVSRLFFQIDSAFAQQNKEKSFSVTIKYIDSVAGNLELRYVGSQDDGVYQIGGLKAGDVRTTASGSLESVTFRLESPLLVQGLHHRSDLMIVGPAGLKITSVKLDLID